MPFFEGHFLKVLFDRMGRILDQVSLILHTINICRNADICCIVTAPLAHKS